MAFFESDGIRLQYRESGSGLPFVFQHGLGADVSQPFCLFKPPAGIRLIAFDARGHGGSATGPAQQISLSASADDLLALTKHLELPGTIVGGISMGAAIALKFALSHPAKTCGLVLSRPAGLERPNPFNQQMFGLVADLIETAGPEEGLRRFQELPVFKETMRDFPDAANSFSKQFRHLRGREIVPNLRTIPNDLPLNDLEELRSIDCPTLILANKQDPVHPYEHGVRLAETIPGAQFREIASKSLDVNRHLREVQQFMEEFFTQTFLSGPQ